MQAVAEQYIVEHGKSDDSFYLVDLGNVNRMLRVSTARVLQVAALRFSHNDMGWVGWVGAVSTPLHVFTG